MSHEGALWLRTFVYRLTNNYFSIITQNSLIQILITYILRVNENLRY